MQAEQNWFRIIFLSPLLLEEGDNQEDEGTRIKPTHEEG
jgi:hypothetical protein